MRQFISGIILINLRYDHLQLTKIFQEFIHDSDFNWSVKYGDNIINKQIKILIELENKFEILLPEKPPAVQETKVAPEAVTDQFIYLDKLYKGIQDSVDYHLRFVVETTRNDNLRQVFLDCYNEEVMIFNLM